MRRAPSGRYLLLDRVGRDIARRRIAARLVAAVIGEELAAGAVEQAAAELIAKRIPHDRVHADEARRQMTDREELHEFHIDELGAGGERQRVAVAAHIRRGAVALVDARQPAGGDDDGLGGDRHRLAHGDVERHRADRFAIADDEIRHRQIADPPYRRDLADPAAQRRGDGGAGVQEVDIAAARSRMTRRVDLGDTAILAPRPADPPFLQFANPRRRVAAQQRGEVLVAQAATGRERVVKMSMPVVGAFLAERRRHRHLRHDRRAAAANKALVDQQHPLGPAARGGDRGVHAGAAGPDNQDICRDIAHAADLVPLARIATIGTAKPSLRRYCAAARAWEYRPCGPAIKPD